MILFTITFPGESGWKEIVPAKTREEAIAWSKGRWPICWSIAKSRNQEVIVQEESRPSFYRRMVLA